MDPNEKIDEILKDIKTSKFTLEELKDLYEEVGKIYREKWAYG